MLAMISLSRLLLKLLKWLLYGEVSEMTIKILHRFQPPCKCMSRAFEITDLTVFIHGVQRRMISVDNFFVFLRLLFSALLLLYVT